MLDLTVFREQFFEIKMPNGEIVEIRKPTQKLALLLGDCQEVIRAQKENDVNAIMQDINKRVLLILNHNKSGRKFVEEEICEFEIDLVRAIIEGYLEWVKQLNSNPN